MDVRTKALAARLEGRGGPRSSLPNGYRNHPTGPVQTPRTTIAASQRDMPSAAWVFKTAAFARSASSRSQPTCAISICDRRLRYPGIETAIGFAWRRNSDVGTVPSLIAALWLHRTSATDLQSSGSMVASL